MIDISKIISDWESTGFLQGYEGYKKEQLAIILDNQKLFNAVAQGGSVPISLIATLYRAFMKIDFITIKAMLGPTLEMNKVVFAAGTKKLETQYKPDNEEVIAASILDEMMKEVTEDLRNNCLVEQVEKGELSQKILVICESGWIIGQPDILSTLSLPKHTLYPWSKYPPNEVMVVWNNQGYCYCPYVPLSRGQFQSKKTLLTRYSKRLFDHSCHTKVIVKRVRL